MIPTTRVRTFVACAVTAALVIVASVGVHSSNAQGSEPTAAQEATATAPVPEPTTTATPSTSAAPTTAVVLSTIPATAPGTAISLPLPTAAPVVTAPESVPTSTGPGGAIVLTPETTTTAGPESSVPGESTTSIDSSTSTAPTSTPTTIAITEGNVDGDDATSEEPPPAFIPVLPPGKTIVRNPTLERLLFKLTAAQKKTVADAQAKADAAQAKVAAAEAALQGIKDKIVQVQADQARFASRVEVLRGQVRDRAMRVYAGEEVQVLDQLLRSEDITALARRIDFVTQAQKNDLVLTEDYQSQRAALDASVAQLDALAAETQKQVEEYRAEQAIVGEELAKVQQQLSFVSTGMTIALGGFVFPVAGPTSFSDTFGAPRMVGTKYYHLHEGTDVFASQGTPLVATNRGVILRKGVGVLGGNKLWLVAADGTQYYYAHLSAFQDGVDDGTVVEAGQVIGYVGNTGNAITTPAHVHFEIHPGGGAAIDPFPILDAVRRSDITALLAAGHQVATTTSTTSTTIPGEVRAGVGVEQEFAVDAAVTPTAAVGSPTAAAASK